ncbi:TraB/GumN family protein [Xanthomonas arboricola pv. juglandis]|uniref:TraB/GumN family protein n=1 Tax=Xanthomonas TaxID=338 RepID=UPI000E5B89CA|nr:MULTISPECIES: TraB/GumN family protein [Xanthomonas]CAD1792528.1 TraB/GumN family protein [Xanthomonas sp. CPBF 426]CAG2090929.1 TraB/GumN family protein [Xanthomonas euroxanthea]SYZ52732.1 TraB/GumN family protein [Xanthomonas arboricola pv. juglandis]
MRTRLATWCCGAVIALGLWGGAAAPTWARAGHDTPAGPPVPLLWKVDGKGGTLYLLGSFHVLKPSDYPLSPDVMQAFAEADRLVFELPPSDAQSPELAGRMLQAARRSDGRRLQDVLDPKTWQALTSYARKRGMQVDSLQPLEPWFVALTISLAEMSRQGMDPAAGLDHYLMAQAQAQGKPADGLERAQEQIALLDGMSPTEQHQLLEEALDDAGTTDQLRQLHAAWRNGDVHTLSTQMAEQMRQHYPALYQDINVERNARWVPRLEQRLGKGSGTTLVVVGALHLLGSDGVVERLRARGYHVERICAACAEQAGR